MLPHELKKHFFVNIDFGWWTLASWGVLLAILFTFTSSVETCRGPFFHPLGFLFSVLQETWGCLLCLTSSFSRNAPRRWVRLYKVIFKQCWMNSMVGELFESCSFGVVVPVKRQWRWPFLEVHCFSAGYLAKGHLTFPSWIGEEGIWNAIDNCKVPWMLTEQIWCTQNVQKHSDCWGWR